MFNGDYEMMKIFSLVQIFQTILTFLNLFFSFYNYFLLSLKGQLATAINAATLALIDAGIPMIDFVCGCTSGYIGNNPIVGTCFSFSFTFIF